MDTAFYKFKFWIGPQNKNAFHFFDILVFFDFFEVEDNFVFEQFFECYTWCAKNISLELLKYKSW